MTDNQKPTILIIDDDPDIVRLLNLFLQKHNYNLQTTPDSQQALTLVTESPPDLILLDIMMPDMDGLELCGRLKKLPELAHVPIIFMTARSKTVDKVRGLELGAVDYVTKPFDHAELLARINTHLTISKLQKKLQQEISDRDNLIDELNAFAHTVAHDLKNPMASSIGYAQMLIQLNDANLLKPEVLVSNLKKIEQTGYKMVNIVDELMLLATVRQEEIELSPLDMEEVIEQVMERMGWLLSEYEPEIIVPDEWPTALGHAPWVEEIWANYISNALKYGGSPPLVALGHTRNEDGTISFWVQDNGKGLTEEEQARLFTEFTRLNTIKVEGHGLGLSIVQRIAGKLGGRVGVESELDSGSRFYFNLPSN